MDRSGRKTSEWEWGKTDLLSDQTNSPEETPLERRLRLSFEKMIVSTEHWALRDFTWFSSLCSSTQRKECLISVTTPDFHFRKLSLLLLFYLSLNPRRWLSISLLISPPTMCFVWIWTSRLRSHNDWGTNSCLVPSLTVSSPTLLREINMGTSRNLDFLRLRVSSLFTIYGRFHLILRILKYSSLGKNSELKKFSVTDFFIKYSPINRLK